MDLGGAGGDGPKVGADAGVQRMFGGKVSRVTVLRSPRSGVTWTWRASPPKPWAERRVWRTRAAPRSAVFSNIARSRRSPGGGDVRAEQRRAQENRREDVGDVVGDAGGESGDACEGWGAGAFGACAEGAFDGGDEALERVLEDVMGGAFPDGRDGAFFPPSVPWENARRIRSLGAGELRRPEAADRREGQVRQNQVGGGAAEPRGEIARVVARSMGHAGHSVRRSSRTKEA